MTTSQRPASIDKITYEKAKLIFKTEYSSYIEMILNVLKEYYSDEFDMLKYLALGDVDTFKDLVNMSPLFINHLLGYKIISQNNDHYYFNIESIKDYLVTKHKYEKALNNSEERRNEISERRNQLEIKLRKIIRSQLLAFLGKDSASVAYLNILGDPRKSKYSGFAYNDLFNPNICTIYFEDVRKVIIKNYDIFKNIFGPNTDEFNTKMKLINKYRSDAHAKDISSEEMAVFRYSISFIEDKVNAFLD